MYLSYYFGAIHFPIRMWAHLRQRFSLPHLLGPWLIASKLSINVSWFRMQTVKKNNKTNLIQYIIYLCCTRSWLQMKEKPYVSPRKVESSWEGKTVSRDSSTTKWGGLWSSCVSEWYKQWMQTRFRERRNRCEFKRPASKNTKTMKGKEKRGSIH